MDGKRDAQGNLVIRRKVGKKVGKKVGTVGKEVSQYHDIEESASGVLTRGLQYARVLRLRRVGKND